MKSRRYFVGLCPWPGDPTHWEVVRQVGGPPVRRRVATERTHNPLRQCRRHYVGNDPTVAGIVLSEAVTSSDYTTALSRMYGLARIDPCVVERPIYLAADPDDHLAVVVYAADGSAVTPIVVYGNLEEMSGVEMTATWTNTENVVTFDDFKSLPSLFLNMSNAAQLRL